MLSAPSTPAPTGEARMLPKHERFIFYAVTDPVIKSIRSPLALTGHRLIVSIFQPIKFADNGYDRCQQMPADVSR